MDRRRLFSGVYSRIDSFVRNSDSTQCISITEELDLTETQLIKDLDDHGMDEEIWPDALKRG